MLIRPGDRSANRSGCRGEHRSNLGGSARRERRGDRGDVRAGRAGYADGELDRALPAKLIGRILAEVRRCQPHIVITFDPFGAYGDPDHVAICQFTSAAVAVAADPNFPSAGEPHQVGKFYYLLNDRDTWGAYQDAFKTLVSHVDGADRHAIAWPPWSISARVDTRAQWPTVWGAVQRHAVQLAIYRQLASLTPAHHEALWGTQTFYRAFSVVNGGRTVETDLFAGLPVDAHPYLEENSREPEAYG